MRKPRIKSYWNIDLGLLLKCCQAEIGLTVLTFESGQVLRNSISYSDVDDNDDNDYDD